jgi:hypothetical protein
MSGEWSPEPPLSRRRRVLRSSLLLVGIPGAILVVLGIVGAIDGLADSDCRSGLFTACGVWMRSLAWMVFVGSYLLVPYYAVLFAVYLLRLATRLHRS